jgi:hypothetical protein
MTAGIQAQRSSFRNSKTFLDMADGVNWHVELLVSPTGPTNLKLIDCRGSSNPKMKPPATLTRIAVASIEFANLC